MVILFPWARKRLSTCTTFLNCHARINLLNDSRGNVDVCKISKLLTSCCWIYTDRISKSWSPTDMNPSLILQLQSLKPISKQVVHTYQKYPRGTNTHWKHMLVEKSLHYLLCAANNTRLLTVAWSAGNHMLTPPAVCSCFVCSSVAAAHFCLIVALKYLVAFVLTVKIHVLLTFVFSAVFFHRYSSVGHQWET